MATVNLYVGFNDKDIKKQVYSDEVLLNTIKDIMKDFYECYTFTQCNGVFKHNDGTVVVEKSVKITLLFESKNDINTEHLSLCIRTLRDGLNQECVAMECVESIVAFV